MIVKRIKLVDGDGRTVRVFAKFVDTGTGHTDGWREEPKPTSPKRLNHPDPAPSRNPADVARSWGISHRGGRRYLRAPGLTLRWENVIPVFDRIGEQIADEATFPLTVEQLRRYVGSK
jgi:hypothetical protein